MTRKEEIEQKAHELSEIAFPYGRNIWARPNLEAKVVNSCCISIAEWADRTMIEKACEWLSKHAKKYYFNKDGHYLGTDELVEDFKLSMEL